MFVSFCLKICIKLKRKSSVDHISLNMRLNHDLNMIHSSLFVNNMYSKFRFVRKKFFFCTSKSSMIGTSIRCEINQTHICRLTYIFAYILLNINKRSTKKKIGSCEIRFEHLFELDHLMIKNVFTLNTLFIDNG